MRSGRSRCPRTVFAIRLAYLWVLMGAASRAFVGAWPYASPLISPLRGRKRSFLHPPRGRGDRFSRRPRSRSGRRTLQAWRIVMYIALIAPVFDLVSSSSRQRSHAPHINRAGRAIVTRAVRLPAWVRFPEVRTTLALRAGTVRSLRNSAFPGRIRRIQTDPTVDTSPYGDLRMRAPCDLSGGASARGPQGGAVGSRAYPMRNRSTPTSEPSGGWATLTTGGERDDLALQGDGGEGSPERDAGSSRH
jgi:hypothetical protein